MFPFFEGLHPRHTHVSTFIFPMFILNNRHHAFHFNCQSSTQINKNRFCLTLQGINRATWMIQVWEVIRRRLAFSVPIIQSGERVIWIIYDRPLPKLNQHILSALCAKPIVSFVSEGQRDSIGLQTQNKNDTADLSRHSHRQQHNGDADCQPFA